MDCRRTRCFAPLDPLPPFGPVWMLDLFSSTHHLFQAPPPPPVPLWPRQQPLVRAPMACGPTNSLGTRHIPLCVGVGVGVCAPNIFHGSTPVGHRAVPESSSPSPSSYGTPQGRGCGRLQPTSVRR